MAITATQQATSTVEFIANAIGDAAANLAATTGCSLDTALDLIYTKFVEDLRTSNPRLFAIFTNAVNHLSA